MAIVLISVRATNKAERGPQVIGLCSESESIFTGRVLVVFNLLREKYYR